MTEENNIIIIDPILNDDGSYTLKVDAYIIQQLSTALKTYNKNRNTARSRHTAKHKKTITQYKPDVVIYPILSTSPTPTTSPELMPRQQ
jgi:hypothetical protein